jgi:hypothetical protein
MARAEVPRRAGDADPATPAQAWKDASFLYLRAANLTLRLSIAMFRARLMPAAVLALALRLAKTLGERGVRARARRLGKSVDGRPWS